MWYGHLDCSNILDNEAHSCTMGLTFRKKYVEALQVKIHCRDVLHSALFPSHNYQLNLEHCWMGQRFECWDKIRHVSFFWLHLLNHVLSVICLAVARKISMKGQKGCSSSFFWHPHLSPLWKILTLQFMWCLCWMRGTLSAFEKGKFSLTNIYATDEAFLKPVLIFPLTCNILTNITMPNYVNLFGLSRGIVSRATLKANEMTFNKSLHDSIFHNVTSSFSIHKEAARTNMTAHATSPTGLITGWTFS